MPEWFSGSMFAYFGMAAIVLVFINSWNGYVALACLALFAGYTYNSEILYYLHDKELLQVRSQEIADESCRQPQLISEQDGVKLYAYRSHCGAEPIYFSSGGTQWEECHAERSGKTSRVVCEQKRISNAHPLPQPTERER